MSSAGYALFEEGVLLRARAGDRDSDPTGSGTLGVDPNGHGESRQGGSADVSYRLLNGLSDGGRDSVLHILRRVGNHDVGVETNT